MPATKDSIRKILLVALILAAISAIGLSYVLIRESGDDQAARSFMKRTLNDNAADAIRRVGKDRN